MAKGIILGIYEKKDSNETPKFTVATQRFNDLTQGRLGELIIKSGMTGQYGESRLFNSLDPEIKDVCIVGIGKEGLGFNELEALHEGMEHVRGAAGIGARLLDRQKCTQIFVDGMEYAEQAAEGSTLGLYKFNDYKSNADKRAVVTELYESSDSIGWNAGLRKSAAQNMARQLCETPAVIMTPTNFAQAVMEYLCPCKMTVEVRNSDWIKANNMVGFLTIARSSCEPPVFLEITYCGGMKDEKPILLIGTGCTFNSGGLNLQNARWMNEYKATMAGAAVVVSTMRAVAELSLPINIVALIPLCENLPSGMAVRCGDVVKTVGGKSIIVHDPSETDTLLLADIIQYGLPAYKPKMLIDVSTTTEAMLNGFGEGVCGLFSNSHYLWRQMLKAGSISGDRVWRLPLWKIFTKQVTSYDAADTSNLGEGLGKTCMAAAVIKEFTPCIDWIHLDIRGVGMNNTTNIFPYLRKHHMSGRPTRTLIQFLYQMSCPDAFK